MPETLHSNFSYLSYNFLPKIFSMCVSSNSLTDNYHRHAEQIGYSKEFKCFDASNFYKLSRESNLTGK